MDRTLVDGTPSYCEPAGAPEPHSYHVALSLEPMRHGPHTIAELGLTCEHGDAIGLELSRPELQAIAERIAAILRDDARMA